jgi:hypothetical protein
MNYVERSFLVAAGIAVGSKDITMGLFVFVFMLGVITLFSAMWKGGIRLLKWQRGE